MNIVQTFTYCINKGGFDMDDLPGELSYSLTRTRICQLSLRVRVTTDPLILGFYRKMLDQHLIRLERYTTMDLKSSIDSHR